MSGAIPFVADAGRAVLGAAVLLRVFSRHEGVADPKVFRKAFSLREAFFPEFLDQSEPMRQWDWILSMVSRRRKQLIRALKSREDRGERHRHYSRVGPFGKGELLAYVSILEGDYYAAECSYVPRLIQAPHDETHLDAGPYLKPLVPKLKKDWHCDNFLFYASVAPEKLDRWINRVAAAAVTWWESDFTAFDSTFTSEAWEMIEGFYDLIYPDHPVQLWDALEAWRAPVGRSKMRYEDEQISYRAPVMNCSGRDDTALANALFNGIATTLSITAAYFGVDITELTEEHVRRISEVVDIAIVGDDSLVACKFDISSLRSAVLANLQRFGLVVKAKVHHDLADVTFLGCMPYPVDGRYYWGPTLGRRLFKAYWQREAVGNLPAWTHGVAQQMLLYRHVPILYDLAKRACQLLSKQKVNRTVADPDKLWQHRSEETPEYNIRTIQWLCRRYREQGLAPVQVVRDIGVIESVERLPAVVRLYTTDASLVTDDL